MGRIGLRGEEIEKTRNDSQIDEIEKMLKLNDMRTKGIAEVLEEVHVLVDLHFYNEFSGTKSSMNLKRSTQNRVRLRRDSSRRPRKLKYTPKTMKANREIQEISSVRKRKEQITKKKEGGEVLVQQNWSDSQCQARCGLL